MRLADTSQPDQFDRRWSLKPSLRVVEEGFSTWRTMEVALVCPPRTPGSDVGPASLSVEACVPLVLCRDGFGDRPEAVDVSFTVAVAAGVDASRHERYR